MIGDDNVGKTSLLLRFVDGEFPEEPKLTIGIDFKIKRINIDEKCVKLQIWHPGVSDIFRTFT